MPTVTFDKDRDKELLKKIEWFQKQRKLPSRVAAVRELCEDALTLKKIAK